MTKTFILRADRSVSDYKRWDNWLMASLDELPGKAIEISIREYEPNLPDNLRARLHILMRAIGNYCGYSESQIKAIIKKSYYPHETLTMAEGKTGRGVGVFMVPKSTMKLTSTEARNIEHQLYALGAELGCEMPQPQSDL